jgi:uncharacterized Tic20 family protein
MDNSFGAVPGPDEIKSDEKMMALFSHLSFFFGGIILPVIFWAVNKDKSKFVTFHALQALWFHIAYAVVIVVFVMVMVIGGLGIGFLTAGSHAFGKGAAGGGSVIIIIIMIAFYAVLFLSMFGGIAYAIYMGIKAYHGEYKKYPIIGNMIYKRVYGHA